jgi:hypothetical protein
MREDYARLFWPGALVISIALALVVESAWPIVAWVVAQLAVRGWQMRGGHHLRYYRQLSPGIFGQAFIAVFVVISLAIAVFSLDSPILNFGWFTLVGQAGEGVDEPTNIVALPLFVPWLAPLFLALLLFLLPALAAAEERVFRAGTLNWTDGLWRSIRFGAAHLIMGIPIGTVIPLTVAGLWLTYHYFRGGTERATVYHLAYNVIIITFAATAIFLITALDPIP